MRLAQRVARRLGWDLTPRRKAKLPIAQLVAGLEYFRIDAVIDVGANVGQYGALLREFGWRGPILSIEPIPEAHAALCARAAGDPAWQVAPPMALGAENGEAVLEVSAESDMSSLLPQAGLLRRLSPSSAVQRRERVALHRLDGLAALRNPGWQRLFVKIDVQGAELQVLAGAEAVMPRIIGLQLEMALVPLYEGERDWRATIDHLATRGFTPYLFLPGYYEPKLARQVQMDGIFYRDRMVQILEEDVPSHG
ncbi:FkbM family methyltransferase [Geminicoccaceae bacterium 1502E]|nr:FkbM family methyltransferase [Geminicoccaceae bacterium 1502E]